MSSEGSNYDPRFQSENIAFEATDLNSCEKCGRANPPTRPTCLYCGGQLDVQAKFATHAVIATVPLEADANASNVVVTTAELNRLGMRPEMISLTGVDAEHLANIKATSTRVPLIRRLNADECATMLTNLSDLELSASVVDDVVLDGSRSPTRISGLEFSDKTISVVDLNTRETKVFRADDLKVVVRGLLSSSKTDIREKRGRKGKAKLLDESSTDADEKILDIYFRGHTAGFRIHLAGFDFSCLGEKRTMLATQNIDLLAEDLHVLAPAAKFVDDYAALRGLIGNVWPLESRTDAQGMIRAGLGKVAFGRVATTNNRLQMNKFSRLQAIDL